MVTEPTDEVIKLRLHALHGAAQWDEYYTLASRAVAGGLFGLSELDLLRICLEKLNDEFHFKKHVQAYLLAGEPLGRLAITLDIRELPQGYKWAADAICEVLERLTLT